MLKTIEKLLERNTNDQTEQKLKKDLRILQQKHKQNSRLLQEFPWLWAVKDSWETATDEIQVTDSKEFCLSSKITDDVKNHPKRIEELWVHWAKSINGRPLEAVRRLNWDESASSRDNFLGYHPKMIWNELVNNYNKQMQVSIFHIVTISFEPDLVTIVRPKKPFKSYNDLWVWDSLSR